MRMCDKCKEKITDLLSVDVQIRGDCRTQLYDYIDSTNLEFCSVKCAISFLKEIDSLIKLKPPQFQQYGDI